MQRFVLGGIGAFALSNAAYMWVAADHWYANVPGVMQTGPLNIHFAKDIALTFLVSGTALLFAGRRHDRSVALFGSGWLVLHALFHIAIWAQRGMPTDIIAFVNLVGIQVPAGLALWAALTLTQREAVQ